MDFKEKDKTKAFKGKNATRAKINLENKEQISYFNYLQSYSSYDYDHNIKNKLYKFFAAVYHTEKSLKCKKRHKDEIF